MFLKVATALDPRHKKLKCLASDKRGDVWIHLETLVKLKIESAKAQQNDQQEDGDDQLPLPRKRSKFEYGSDEEDTDEERIQTTSSLEAKRLVDMYRGLPLCDDDNNPLVWWQLHQNSLAPMAELVLKYLACPATSVPSERLFSVAGNIVSKKRASLLPENANTLICLSNWLSK